MGRFDVGLDTEMEVEKVERQSHLLTIALYEGRSPLGEFIDTAVWNQGLESSILNPWFAYTT